MASKKKSKKTETSKTKTVYEQLAYIQQHLKAPKNQFNKFGNYNYRSCEDILEGLKDVLGDFSIIVNDEIVVVGERYYVKATATLTDGNESISNSAFARESENKKGMDDSQVTGATSSYARKYALNGLFAIDDTKDADSKDNSQSATDTKTAKKTTASTVKLASEKQKKLIFALAKDLDIDSEKAKEVIKGHFSLDSFTQLSSSQASQAIDNLQKKIESKENDIDLDEADKEIDEMNQQDS